MTKQQYLEVINTQREDVLNKVYGYHELVNVLQAISDYTNICICMTERIYNDKDINYSDYVDLNETISNALKEVCRVVKRG